ncbi:MAG TPA: hypothetical protein VMY39_09375, partial [Planctomycetota bacterium]|nr:hypothetical protein [Planctomycetota bacterium]
LHHSPGWMRGLRAFVGKYWAELPLFVVSLTFARHGLGRSDLTHVTNSGLSSCILSMLIVMRHYLPGWLRRTHLEKAFAVTVVTMMLVTGVILAWQTHSRDLWRSQFSVRIADEAWIPEDYREAVKFLRDTLGPEDHFYTMTSEGTWYYWANRPSPTRFPVVWFAAPRFYQQEVVESLEASKTRIILYRNDAVMWAPDNISILERCPIIAEYLETHYKPYRRIGRHEFWIRREE